MVRRSSYGCVRTTSDVREPTDCINKDYLDTTLTNYMDLTSTQIISGSKSFKEKLHVSKGIALGDAKNAPDDSFAISINNSMSALYSNNLYIQNDLNENKYTIYKDHIITLQNNSATNSITLPDKSGTLAIREDIDSELIDINGRLDSLGFNQASIALNNDGVIDAANYININNNNTVIYKQGKLIYGEITFKAVEKKSNTSIYPKVEGNIAELTFKNVEFPDTIKNIASNTNNNFDIVRYYTTSYPGGSSTSSHTTNFKFKDISYNNTLKELKLKIYVTDAECAYKSLSSIEKTFIFIIDAYDESNIKFWNSIKNTTNQQ